MARDMRVLDFADELGVEPEEAAAYWANLQASMKLSRGTKVADCTARKLAYGAEYEGDAEAFLSALKVSNLFAALQLSEKNALAGAKGGAAKAANQLELAESTSEIGWRNATAKSESRPDVANPAGELAGPEPRAISPAPGPRGNTPPPTPAAPAPVPLAEVAAFDDRLQELLRRRRMATALDSVHRGLLRDAFRDGVPEARIFALIEQAANANKREWRWIEPAYLREIEYLTGPPGDEVEADSDAAAADPPNNVTAFPSLTGSAS